jgi:SHS2 domain-containing protein
MTDAPPFEFVEGATSDVSFVARGESLGALFAAAAEALLDVAVENPASVEAREEQRLELEDGDLELLLLRFLNELVYRLDARGLLLRAREVRVDREGAALRLRATLVGETLDRARHVPACDVKAATAHGLSVRRTARGFEARVTLDV